MSERERERDKRFSRKKRKGSYAKERVQSDWEVTELCLLLLARVFSQIFNSLKLEQSSSSCTLYSLSKLHIFIYIDQHVPFSTSNILFLENFPLFRQQSLQLQLEEISSTIMNERTNETNNFLCVCSLLLNKRKYLFLLF